MVEIVKVSDFQPGYPGSLVQTHFEEKDQTGRVITLQGDAFVPNPLPPMLDRVGIVGRLFDMLDRAKTQLLRLEAAVDRLPDPRLLLDAMRLREAQASSRIENTFATLRDLALANVDPNSASSDVLEVRRNRQAIELGLQSRIPVSRRLICDMHAALITSPSKRPGKFRDIQVCIGDHHLGFKHARFVPPPAAHLDACVKAWELFANPTAIEAPTRDRWPYLIELAWTHYQFETIHPFSDGNGRIGRALVQVAPVIDGFLKHPICNLSEWVQQHRQEYYDRLLRVSTHGDWVGWTAFFGAAVAEQAELDLQRADRVLGLYHRYRQTITQDANSIRLVPLIDSLFSHQGTTISLAAEVMGLSYTAAQRHVEFLVSKGVLKQHSEGNYAKIYLATEIIDAIRGDGED